MLRRRALTGIAVAVVATVVAVATTDAREAASRPAAYRVAHQFWCGKARTMRFTFWPKGNLGPGTPSKFPEGTYGYGGNDPWPTPDRTLPHLNGYRKGTSWADRKWLIFISQPNPSGGSTSEASVGWRSDHLPCSGPLPGGEYDDPHDGATVLKRSTKPTALRCRFTSRFGYVAWGGSPKHRTAAVIQHQFSQKKHPMLLRATLGAKHPAMIWNTAFCQRIPLPR